MAWACKWGCFSLPLLEIVVWGMVSDLGPLVLYKAVHEAVSAWFPSTTKEGEGSSCFMRALNKYKGTTTRVLIMLTTASLRTAWNS